MRNSFAIFMSLLLVFCGLAGATMETRIIGNSELKDGYTINMTFKDNKFALSSQGSFIDRAEYDSLSSKWADVEGGDATQTGTVQNGTYSLRIEDNNNDRGGTGDFIERSFDKGKPEKISLDMRITGGLYHDTTVNFVTNSDADGVRGADEKTVFNLNMGNYQPEFKFCGKKMFEHNSDQWYDVEIKDINYSSHTADVYVDGSKELEDAEFCSEEDTVSGMRIMADAGGTGEDGFYDDIVVSKPAKKQGKYTSRIYNKTGHKDYEKLTVNTTYSSNSNLTAVFKGLNRDESLEEKKIVELFEGEQSYDLGNLEGQATQVKINGTVAQKGDSFSVNSLNWSYNLIPTTEISKRNYFNEGNLTNLRINSNKLSLLNQSINQVEGFESYSTGNSNIQNWQTGDGCGTCQTDSQSESGSMGFVQDDGSLNNWSDDWQSGLVRDFSDNPLKGKVIVTGEYWESTSNHDGNFWVRACDGTNLAGIGTENPQFEAVTANGGEVVNIGGNSYQSWVNVNMTLMLDQGKVDFRWNQDGGQTVDKNGYDIPKGKAICKVGVGPDDIWYIDDIGIISEKGGGQGRLSHGNYTTQELSFNQNYSWSKIGLNADLKSSTSLNATFRSLKSGGSILGEEEVELQDGLENYSLTVPDSEKAQIFIEGSTEDSSKTWSLNSLKLYAGSPANISLSWSHPGSPDGFKVYSNASGSMSQVADVSSMTYEDSSDSVSKGDYICYEVTAYNQYGESDPTPEDCATVP